MVLAKPPEYLVRVGLLDPEARGTAMEAAEKKRISKPGSKDLKLCWNWLNKQVAALK